MTESPEKPERDANGSPVVTIFRPAKKKIFRPSRNGMLEKFFVDHNAKPRRAYGTGELYRPLTDSDAAPTDEEEDIVIYDPADFTPHKYRRVTGIKKCFFPKPFDSEPLESDSPAG